MDIDPERIARSPFLIGAVGALVTAIKFTPGASWPERGFNIVAGALCAGFITPALVEWLHMSSNNYVSGAAFVVRLLGMSFAAAILDGIKSLKVADIISGWISRRS